MSARQEISFLIVLLLLATSAQAQRFKDLPKDTAQWVTPQIVGDRPSKAISVSYSLNGNTEITSESQTTGLRDTIADLSTISEFELKVRAPIKWKGRTRIVAGVNYRYEEYTFESSDPEYDLYANLQRKHLKALSSTVYINHSLTRRRFLVGRLGAEVNGDYRSDEISLRRQLKYSAALAYGWKPNIYTVFGVGLYYSYSYGRPRAYPAVIINRTFNERWGLETVLPANARLRYTFNNKTYLLAALEVVGASYRIAIDDPPLSDYPSLELRNSRLHAGLEFEREIYDFLWFQLSAGYRFNISFNVAEDNTANENILENRLEPVPYGRLMIFIVPPRKLLTRFLNTADSPEAN